MGKNKVRKYYLNLNSFRNWNFHVANNLKKKYKEILYPQLHNKRFEGVLHIKYTVYKGDKRSADLDNLTTVHIKFFQDALVEIGAIKEDNVNVIQKTTCLFGGYDKGNGRVEIEIYRMEN